MRWRYLLLIFPLTLNATDGLLPIGHGAPSLAMGGVGIAWSLDTLNGATNPATLPCVGRRFDITFHDNYHRDKLTLRGERTATGEPVTYHSNVWVPALDLGAHLPLPHCLSLALLIYQSASWRVDYDVAIPEYGETPLRSRFDQFHIAPTISAQLGCHQLGASLQITLSRLEIDGLQFFSLGNPNPNLISIRSSHPDEVTNKGSVWEGGVSGRIGWMCTPLARLTVGAIFQTPGYSEQFQRYRGFLPGSHRISLPAQLGFGATWQFDSHTRVGLDVVKIFWHQGSLFENQLTDQNRMQLGEEEGPGFGWDAQLALKLGVAWTPLCGLTIRAGWNHVNTPIAPQDGFLNALNMQGLESHATVGMTWSCRNNQLSGFYIHGFRHTDAGYLFEGFRTSLVNRQHELGIAYARCF